MNPTTRDKLSVQSRVSPGMVLATWGWMVTALGSLVAIGMVGDAGPLGVVALCVDRGLAWWPAIVFGATAWGLGCLLRPLIGNARESASLQLALGSAALLTLSHVLGQVGLLHGTTGLVVTLCVSALGMASLVLHVRRDSRAKAVSADATTVQGIRVWESLSRGLVIGVVLFGVANPPGALWGSEFGGYDVLSYHLQLPQEWLANGRVAPVEHNVYSYLPGYMESAYLYIAALTNAPTTPEFPGGPMGLLAGSGWRVNSCQALHAEFLFVAALLVGALASSVVGAGRMEESDSKSVARRRQVSLLASSVFLFTPWSVVVGTLAYNEMPMLALFAGALLAATSRDLSPARRGMVSGMLVAVACGVKPTALLFVGVPTGIVLLGMMPMREWWKAVVPGVVVALLFLMPWMVRNMAACGNPVFPFALTRWLGTAHWDGEQVERFLRHHVSQEPIAERLRLLVMPDANDPAARPGHPVFRGLTHPQWGVFFGLVAMAMAHAVFWLRGVSRRLAILVSLAIVVQVMLWLLTTHVQSRFLLPLIVPCVVIVAMASRVPEGSAGVRRLSRRAMSVACWLGVIAQGGFLAATIALQHDGHPAMLLPLEPADFTPAAWYRETSQARREELVASSPAIATAVLVPRGERVVLLGEAAPLYYPPGVGYNTVWDRWPFQDGRLTDAEARYVLVDFASIDRYERSGYLPPGVTLLGVQGWVARSCRVIRAWDDQGKVLVEVER